MVSCIAGQCQAVLSQRNHNNPPLSAPLAYPGGYVLFEAEKNGVPVPDDSVKEAFADVVNGERDQTDVNGWGLYAGER